MSDTAATPAQLATVSDRAAASAAEYLRERFAGGDLDAAYTPMDVKTAADVAAEERILAVVRDAYPDHAIAAEESGEHPGDGHYRWVVDPLDGTNNFAVGIPTVGVGVTAIEAAPAGAVDAGSSGEERPVATAVHVPVLEDRYVATRDGGVTYNGDGIAVTDGDVVPLPSATVGCVIGAPVLASSSLQADHEAITDAVRDRCKRVIQCWAPLVYWGLLARGRLDGFVCFHPDEREQAAGLLLARVAGCVVRGDGSLSVYGATEAIADGVWDAARNAV